MPIARNRVKLGAEAEKPAGSSSSRGFFDRLQRHVDKTLQKAGWLRDHREAMTGNPQIDGKTLSNHLESP